MVIAVNGWMNHPSGFRLVDGKVVDVHPLDALFGNSYFWHELVHMYLAGYMVTGFLVAGAYAFARLRGRWGRYERTALAIPLTSPRSPRRCRCSSATGPAATSRENQPIKLAAFEGLGHDDEGRAGAHPRLVLRRRGRVRDRDPEAALAARVPRPERDRAGARHGPARRPAAGERRPLRVPDDGRDRDAARPARRRSSCSVRSRRRRLPESRWFYRALVLAGPLALVALIAGWVTTEVGRQPWVVYRVMRTSAAVTGAQRHPGRATHPRARLPRARGRRRLDPPPARADAAPGGVMRALRPAARLRARRARALRRARRRRLRRRLLAAHRRRDPGRIRDHAHHAMGPVWEANHVWLIFVLTVVWTAYPTAFGSIASTLSIPLFIAAVGIIFRGDGVRAPLGRARRAGSSGAVDTAFSLSSILTPFALGAVVGGIASLRVPVGQRRRQPRHELAQPDLDPDRHARRRHGRVPRRRLPRAATRCGSATPSSRSRSAGARSAPGVVGRRGRARRPPGRPLGRARALPRARPRARASPRSSSRPPPARSTLALVWRRRYEPARYGAAVAVAAIIAGWALAQSPVFLEGLTVKAGRGAARHARRGRRRRRRRRRAPLPLARAAVLARAPRPVRRGAPAAAVVPGGREVLAASAPGLLGRAALACLIAGTGFTVLADSAWAHAIGLTLLSASSCSASPPRSRRRSSPARRRATDEPQRASRERRRSSPRAGRWTTTASR